VRRLLALALVACGHPAPATIALEPAPAASAPAPVHAKARRCAPDVAAPVALPIPPALEALAAQYFHANAHDDGFNDLIHGTSRYAWYDPSDLDVRVDPPGDIAMIRRSTPSFFFGWAGAGASARIARRADRQVRPAPWTRVYDLDAMEDAAGVGWFLGSDLGATTSQGVHLLRVDRALATHDEIVATLNGDDPWDRRVAETETGRVVVAWVARSPTGLDVVAAWRGPAGFSAPRVVDHVTVPAAAAELSLRSTTNLRLAADGADRVALAWRPLVPAKGEVVDPGSASSPPTRAVTAEVRIVVFSPSGLAAPPRVHAATAQPLGFTTGVGPWPLTGNGMASATLAGTALFFWNDDASGRVLLATPDDATARAIETGRYRILPRPSARGLEVLLLHSVGPQAMVRVTCR